MDGSKNNNPKRRTRRNFLRRCGAASVALGLPACAQPSPTADPTPVARMDLDALITAEMRRAKIAGAAACIIRAGAVEWIGGFGWADIARQVPMTPQVMLNVASVTKTVTAAALMQLWERGLFDLDEDINRSSPFPIRNPHHSDTPITYRQLLTHTSSLRDGPAYPSSYACGDPTVSLAEWLAGYLTPGAANYDVANNFSTDAPGERFAYSNVGFGVVGLLVEALSQESFTAYCQGHIFDPLGMDHSTFHLSDLAGRVHAIPYQTNPSGGSSLRAGEGKDGFTPLCLYSFSNIPDGMLRASASDLARFVIACLADGDSAPQILKPATLEKMMAPEIVKPNGVPITQGLGWYAVHYPGQQTWGHGGADPGVRTQVYLNRQDKSGVVVIANSEGDTGGIVALLAKALSQTG